VTVAENWLCIPVSENVAATKLVIVTFIDR